MDQDAEWGWRDGLGALRPAREWRERRTRLWQHHGGPEGASHLPQPTCRPRIERLRLLETLALELRPHPGTQLADQHDGSRSPPVRKRGSRQRRGGRMERTAACEPARAQRLRDRLERRPRLHSTGSSRRSWPSRSRRSAVIASWRSRSTGSSGRAGIPEESPRGRRVQSSWRKRRLAVRAVVGLWATSTYASAAPWR